MDTKVDHIIKRQGQLESMRAPWESLWQDCTDFVNPRRGDFSIDRHRGDRTRYDKVFDSTAPLANEQLASGLHGFLTSSAEQWFSLTIPQVNDILSQSVRNWLQGTTETMFDDVFNTPESNFTTAVHELYLDLGSYGTGVMYVEDRPGRPINFRTFHLAECYIAEDSEGRVDTLYRKYKHTARQLVQMYGDKLPEKFVETAYKQPHQEFTCIHAVEPRETYSPKTKMNTQMPYSSCYVLMEEKILLDESGFNEFPYLVPRWSKTAGEIYGRSPAMTCLPDIRMVNEMTKTVIRAAQKLTDPPLLVPDDGFMLPLRTVPGGLNYYRSGTQDKIEPLMNNARPDIGLDFIESRRDHILKTFHVDWLQMRQEGPQMTATEVLQRQEEKMRLLGPMVGRLQTEFLGPLIDRVFAIMARRQAIASPPPEIQGAKLKVEYVSPVARAQRSQSVFNFSRFMEQIMPLANIRPEIFDNLDADGAFKWAHGTLDAPMETLMSEENVAQMRQQRQEQQEAAMQAEQAQQLAGAAKDANAAGILGGTETTET